MKQQSFGVTLWVSNLNFNKYSFSETLIIGWLMSICECTIVVGNWVFKFMELLKCLNLLEIHWFFWIIFFGFLSFIFFYIYKKKKIFWSEKKMSILFCLTIFKFTSKFFSGLLIFDLQRDLVSSFLKFKKKKWIQRKDKVIWIGIYFLPPIVDLVSDRRFQCTEWNKQHL